MYCVIQEIENRKSPHNSTSKKIEVNVITYTINGVTYTSYSYSYSPEKFERSIKKAYKINIHKSCRENGEVKKKQWVICTMGYYDLLDSWPGDFVIGSTLSKKLDDMGISEETLWDMVYKKLNSIINKVKAEFEQTEEYQAQQEQKRIIDKYQENKSKFEEKYGADTYKYCYDVFGTLRNKAYLNELKLKYKAQQQYKSSYQNYDYSNYSNYSNYSSSYFGIGHSNYTEEEAKLAADVITAGYKCLCKKYHPDVGGTTEQFQQLGTIKDKLLELIKK